MRRWDDENAMHKLGTFAYSLEEIGLDEAFVRTRMRGYLEFLDGLERHVAHPWVNRRGVRRTLCGSGAWSPEPLRRSGRDG